MENIYLNRFFGALNYGAYWDDLPETIIVAINQNSPNTRESDCGIDPTEAYQQNNNRDFLNLSVGNLYLISKTNTEQSSFKMIAGHDTTAAFIFLSLQRKPLI
jgi:hypothetical protein